MMFIIGMLNEVQKFELQNLNFKFLYYLYIISLSL